MPQRFLDRAIIVDDEYLFHITAADSRHTGCERTLSFQSPSHLGWTPYRQQGLHQSVLAAYMEATGQMSSPC
jgi:hypothetical protein